MRGTKNVANKASEQTKDTGLRELCCYSFARMLNANDLKTIDEIFENLCNLLLSGEYGSEQEVNLVYKYNIFQ